MLSQFEPHGLRVYFTAAIPLLLLLGMVWFDQLQHALRAKRTKGE